MKRFGEFILKNQILLIIAILAITALFSLHLPDLRLRDDETTWFPKGDPTLELYNAFEETFTSPEFALVAYQSDNPFEKREMDYLSYLSEELEKVPYVDKVLSLTTVDDIVGTEEGLEVKPLIETEGGLAALKQRIERNPFIKGNLISSEGKTLGLILEILREGDKPDSEISEEFTSRIKEVLSKEHKATGRRFYLGGVSITDAEVNMMVESDIQRFFPITLLLTALILLVVFKNPACIFFPLLAVLLSLEWTLGLKGMLNSPITPISTTLFALITVIGIANSVHLISHYRIELPRLKDRRRALLETYERAGRPCLFTSLTTAVGFGSLLTSPIPSIRNLGLFAGFGIMCAFILSMILVPLGLRLTQIRNPGSNTMDFMGRMLAWIGRFNLKNIRGILILSLSVILVMGIGIPRIHMEGTMLEYFKKKSRLRKETEFLDQKLAGTSSVEVIIHADPDAFKEPTVLKKIEGLQRTIESHPKVSVSYSLVDYLKLINRALNNEDQTYFRIPETRGAVAQSLLLYESSGGTNIEDYVTVDYDMARISIRTKQMRKGEREELIERIKRYVDQNLGDYKVDITGWDSLVHKVTRRIVLTQIQSLGLALGVILGLMLLLFGLRGGVISIVPNILPIVFVLGLMGHAGFDLNIATAIITSIAMGIVVDDTIHYFSHFRHEFKLTRDRKQAMLNALQKVGRAMCFTTLILVLGFTVFLLSETSILADYGVLSSIAVITALLGDLFLGPVLLTRLKVF